MKAFLAALILAASPTAVPPPAVPAAPAATPEVVGVIAYGVDKHLYELVFVFNDGGIYQISAKDCVDSPACKAEVDHLIAIKHVRVIDVSTGTKV